ncbi:MAG: hypothetical protein GX896_03960 [Clostridiales bacterium]|mgnify:CR=1 FL=1|nr:hypothetical protein [Clostridiales bacterium]
MNMSAITKGIAMGVAVGAVTYTVSNATKHQKKKMKSSTGKAIKAVGDMVQGISYMFH